MSQNEYGTLLQRTLKGALLLENYPYNKSLWDLEFSLHGGSFGLTLRLWADCRRLILAWVLVRGFNLNHHNKETIVYTIDPHYGTLIN